MDKYAWLDDVECVGGKKLSELLKAWLNAEKMWNLLLKLFRTVDETWMKTYNRPTYSATGYQAQNRVQSIKPPVYTDRLWPRFEHKNLIKPYK